MSHDLYLLGLGGLGHRALGTGQWGQDMGPGREHGREHVTNGHEWDRCRYRYDGYGEVHLKALASWN